MHRHRIYAFMVAVFLLLVATAGCMEDDEEDVVDVDVAEAEPTPTPVTAESVLAAASDEWTETESAHFALAVDGDVFLDDEETIRLVSAEGDILRPDSVEASAKVSVETFAIDIQMIAVGGDMFMTNLVTGEWDEAPEDFDYDPSVLFDEADGVGPVLTELEGASLEGEEQIDGVEVRTVEGTVPAEVVEDITAGAIEGDEIDVTVWIGAEDAKLYKVTLVEPSTVEGAPATWTLLLSDHNEDVEIEAPEIGTPES